MTMPAPPGDPNDPNDPGDRSCPGCPNYARPAAFGPPGGPGFPPGPGDASRFAALVGMLDRFRPFAEMVGDLLSEAAEIFRPGPDEARLEAEALRSRHAINVMETAARLYRDAAFYENSGAKDVAAKMLSHIGEILASVERGREADAVAERARMEERAHILRVEDEALAAEEAVERAKAKGPCRAPRKKGSRPAPAGDRA